MSVIHDPEGTIARAAQQAVQSNIAAGRTVALAESCTGGMIATAMTDVPGSSAVLLASIVTYAYSAKQDFLGVSGEILETFGAVSEACAWAMAQGALDRSGADVAVAVSGIAGPDGGTPAKPVGTVMFARVERGQSPDQAVTLCRHFDPAGSRDDIRRQAAVVALELLDAQAGGVTGA